ncbi:hypothetical protein D3C81_1488110 [compost metagenome]
MPAEQRGGNFAAAFQGHVAQVARVDAGGLGDQRGLHPVLAADGAARADDHFARVFLQCGDQVGEGLVRRIALDRDGAVAGADGGQPLHRVLIEAAELALGQVQQRSTGPGYQRAGIARTLGDHRVVGHCADATGHVGHAHRLAEDVLLHQRALYQLAGQVEATAGRGGGDAFGAFRFAGEGVAGQQQAAGSEDEAAQ